MYAACFQTLFSVQLKAPPPPPPLKLPYLKLLVKLYDLRAYNRKFTVHRYKADLCFYLPLRSMHVTCAMWIINLLALQGIISYTSQPRLASL